MSNSDSRTRGGVVGASASRPEATAGASAPSGAPAAPRRTTGATPTATPQRTVTGRTAQTEQPPYRVGGAVVDGGEGVSGAAKRIEPMTVRQGFTVDVTAAPGTSLGRAFSNQGEVSARCEVYVGDPTHTGVIFEGGAKGFGCCLITYNGRFYWQSGNGRVTSGNVTRSLEVSAPIDGVGAYVVEVSSSVSEALGAIYIDGVRRDVNGPPTLDTAAGANSGFYDGVNKLRNNVSGTTDLPAFSAGAGNECLSNLFIYQNESYTGL